MAGRIELKTSDLYHKNKRNLMLLCSAIIVVALAGPGPQIKIPGFGEDVKLSTPMAFAVAMVAVFYFFWQFFVDWRTARALNSDSLSKTSPEDLDAALAEMFDSIKTTSANVLGQLKAVNAVTGTFARLDEIMTVDMVEKSQAVVELWQGPHGTAHASDTGRPLEALLRQNFSEEVIAQFKYLRQDMTRLETQMIEIQQNIGPVLSGIDQNTEELQRAMTEQVRQLRSLSKTISGTQRVNFWLDISICSALPLLSLLCTAIVFWRPGWTWPCAVI
jgi:hypothetical protein